MQEVELPVLMTVKEAAEYLSVTPQTIRRWADEELLNYIRIGKEYRIVRDSLAKSLLPEKNFKES